MSHVVVDKVQIVTRSQSHSTGTSFAQTRVGLMEGLVYKHKAIDDGLSVRGRDDQLLVHGREHIRTLVLERERGGGEGDSQKLW